MPEPLTIEEAARRRDETIRRAHASYERAVQIIEARSKPPAPRGLPERNVEIFALREGGMQFAEIARRFNLTPPRVRQIYDSERLKRASPVSDKDALLGVRARNAIKNAGIPLEPRAVFEYGYKNLANTPNFGSSSLTQIAAWLKAHGFRP